MKKTKTIITIIVMASIILGCFCACVGVPERQTTETQTTDIQNQTVGTANSTTGIKKPLIATYYAVRSWSDGFRPDGREIKFREDFIVEINSYDLAEYDFVDGHYIVMLSKNSQERYPFAKSLALTEFAGFDIYILNGSCYIDEATYNKIKAE